MVIKQLLNGYEIKSILTLSARGSTSDARI